LINTPSPAVPDVAIASFGRSSFQTQSETGDGQASESPGSTLLSNFAEKENPVLLTEAIDRSVTLGFTAMVINEAGFRKHARNER
jgi:hypothetical protein